MNEPEKAGQESTRVPDFLPGWFTPRIQPTSPDDEPGAVVVDSSPREAVRWFAATDFPIAFLKSSESVSPARPPQKGVSIRFGRGDNDFSLAVPPGYWIFRDHADHLQLANDDDWRKRWVRATAMLWTTKAHRAESENPHLSDEAREAFKVAEPGVKRVARPAAAERNIHGHPDPLERERDLERSAPRRTATSENLAEMTRGAEKVLADLADGSGWKGTEPAKGTRRRIVRDVIRESSVANDDGSLELADAVEAALLDAAANEEAMQRGIEDGWQGTPPNVGTRRHLILSALTDRFPGYTAERRLALADTIESALLQDTINEEADRKAGEIIASGIVKVDPECKDAPPSIVRLKEESEERLRRVARIIENGSIGGQTGEAICESIKKNVLEKHSISTGVDPAWAKVKAECARLEDICEERWSRIGELEDQLEAAREAREAIDGVGETLDRLDAPQAATFAKRIDRLFTSLRQKVEVANVRGRIDKGKAIDYDRVHNLLDGWEIRREDDDEATRSLLERAREFVERLRRTEEDLDTEQHRVARIPAKDVRPGTRELHIVVADDHTVDVHRTLFIELEDQDGRGVGGFERRPGTPGTERIVIPYGRDDEWVQRVAMAAIVAGQDADKPFPPNALESVLEEFGVEPTMPRTWPHRDGETSAFEKALQEIPAHFKDAEVNEARRVFDELSDDGETEHDHGNRWMATAEESEGLTDNERRLYDQREEARAGEGRFAEERDCAYALLRWLLPVVVAKRIED